MKIFGASFSVKTSKQVELVNITSEISRIVHQSDVREGLVLIYSPHTTTGIIINEDESHLVRDIENVIKEIVPWDGDYGHNSVDDNAAAHIAGAVLSGNANVPVANSQLELGTWQSIFLVELDGPRQRTIKVKIVGD